MEQPLKIRKPGFGEHQDLTGTVNIELRVGYNEGIIGLCKELGIDTSQYMPIALDVYATEYSPKKPHLTVYAKNKNSQKSNEITEFRLESFPFETLFSFLRGFHVLASPDYSKIEEYHIVEKIEI